MNAALLCMKIKRDKIIPRLVVSLLLAGAIIMSGSSLLRAQRAEITPFGGFQFGGVFRLINGELKIKTNACFGLALDLYIREHVLLEFIYSRQETGMELVTDPSREKTDLFNLAIEYYQFGVVYHFGYGKYIPFGMFTVGASRFDPYETGTGSEYFFTIGGTGGVKLFINENIGVRLQARLLIPFQSGSDLFCGEDVCRIGVSSSTGIAQGELSAGLILRF